MRARRGIPFFSLIVATVLAVAPTPGRSDTPTDLNFQGRLLDAGGNPLAGPVDLEVGVWSAATNGTRLYRELHNDVELGSEGVFSIVVGTGTSQVGSLDAQTFSDAQRFLEVAVDGEKLQPRLRFNSVAFALQAAQATSATSIAGVSARRLGALAGCGQLVLEEETTSRQELTCPNGTLLGAECIITDANRNDGLPMGQEVTASGNTATCEPPFNADHLRLTVDCCLSSGVGVCGQLVLEEETTSRQELTCPNGTLLGAECIITDANRNDGLPMGQEVTASGNTATCEPPFNADRLRLTVDCCL